MKANEFFRRVGIDAVKSYINAYEDHLTCELKRLIKSHDLVESKGGLELSKKEVRQRSIVRWVDPEVEALRQAVQDVESCQ